MIMRASRLSGVTQSPAIVYTLASVRIKQEAPDWLDDGEFRVNAPSLRAVEMNYFRFQ